MDLELKYGDGVLHLSIPDANLGAFVKPSPAHTGDDPDAALERAVAGSPVRLEEKARDKDVCVLVADATRDQPHIPMVRAMARRLKSARSVRFVITTGSHRPDSPDNLQLAENIALAAGECGLTGADAVVHDCRNAEFTNLGRTSFGTPVQANSAAVGAGLYLVASDMKFHYFAGYSNAVKHFLPGICAFESTEANHSFALEPSSTFGRHPLHPDPSRRDNRLANDQMEGMELICGRAEVYVLGTVADRNSVAWAEFGPLKDILPKGIRFIDENTSFTLPRFKRVVVNCGGFPNDESLYTAQRGVELTRNAFAPKAEILFLAGCRNGIAPNPESYANFYDRLKGPLEDSLKVISENYRLYSHKAYRFAQVLLSSERLHLFSRLPEEQVRAVHMHPVSHPQAVIDKWLAAEPEVQIAVFEEANKLAVFAGES